MTLRTELVLHADVQVIPVRDFEPSLREKFDARQDDYVITRPGSRAPSNVVDNDTAALLELFRMPMGVVDAVLSLAAERELDPEDTLEQVYPILSQLYDAKLLIPAADLTSCATRSRLEVGDIVNDFQILRSVQKLDDTEVFLGRNRRGEHAAIKFCPAAYANEGGALEREAIILRGLGGIRAPAVLGLTRTEAGVALITEWVSGLDAASSAAGMRGRREPRDEERLFQLCVDIAQAFADVHGSGVIHGDVHPRNIIVEATGRARLIDFGPIPAH